MYKDKDFIPALLRPGMYTGLQGERTLIQWQADALVELFNWKEKQNGKSITR